MVEICKVKKLDVEDLDPKTTQYLFLMLELEGSGTNKFMNQIDISPHEYMQFGS